MSKIEPFFSIVIPVYNIYDKALIRCVSSVLNQSFKGFEAIIINDGSTKQCRKCIDQFKNQMNIKIIHQSNKGVSAARNEGIRQSKGKYLLFLDGDDFFESQCLERLYDTIKNLDVDVMFFKNQVFIENTSHYISFKDTDQLSIINDKKMIQLDVIAPNFFNNEYNYGTPWSKVINTSLIKNNKIVFQENLPRAQDRVFMFDVLNIATKIFHFNYSGYIYNSNPYSICSKYNKDLWDKLNRVYSSFKTRVMLVKDIDFEMQLRYAKVNFYFESLDLDVFHNDNKCSLFSSYKRAKTIFDKEIKKEISGMNVNYFPIKRRVLIYLHKIHMQYIVYLLYIVRNIK